MSLYKFKHNLMNYRYKLEIKWDYKNLNNPVTSSEIESATYRIEPSASTNYPTAFPYATVPKQHRKQEDCHCRL
jgi:hypothetical protein